MPTPYPRYGLIWDHYSLPMPCPRHGLSWNLICRCQCHVLDMVLHDNTYRCRCHIPDMVLYWISLTQMS
ncbi:hypothetical protein F383_29544 [Gossypium arboreum]|uniref:Uncharacterized protein n=1 Tax=Gossypium arboreum TaxID=29729 RepID=A0A0B0MUJ1_GOSAR|nr:hypothetical protein F383_29544 [Gossypium arboreum]